MILLRLPRFAAFCVFITLGIGFTLLGEGFTRLAAWCEDIDVTELFGSFDDEEWF